MPQAGSPGGPARSSASVFAVEALVRRDPPPPRRRKSPDEVEGLARHGLLDELDVERRRALEEAFRLLDRVADVGVDADHGPAADVLAELLQALHVSVEGIPDLDLEDPESPGRGTRRPRPESPRSDLMPIVIEVGSASWARPRTSASGRPARWPRRSCSAMSTAARAAGVNGKRSADSRQSARRVRTSRPRSHSRLPGVRRGATALVRLAGDVLAGGARAEAREAVLRLDAHDDVLDLGHRLLSRDGVGASQRKPLGGDRDRPDAHAAAIHHRVSRATKSRTRGTSSSTPSSSGKNDRNPELDAIALLVGAQLCGRPDARRSA